MTPAAANYVKGSDHAQKKAGEDIHIATSTHVMRLASGTARFVGVQVCQASVLTAQRCLGVAADDVLADFLSRQHATLLAVLGPQQTWRFLHAAIAALALDRIPAEAGAGVIRYCELKARCYNGS